MYYDINNQRVYLSSKGPIEKTRSPKDGKTEYSVMEE